MDLSHENHISHVKEWASNSKLEVSVNLHNLNVQTLEEWASVRRILTLCATENRRLAIKKYGREGARSLFSLSADSISTA